MNDSPPRYFQDATKADIQKVHDATLDEMNKIGMTVGQLLRQFGELKKATPEGMADLAEALVGRGKKSILKAGGVFTPEAKAELSKLAKVSIEANRAEVVALAAWGENIGKVERIPAGPVREVAQVVVDAQERRAIDATRDRQNAEDACFPHARGDGPLAVEQAADRLVFSPHTWGLKLVTGLE